MQKEKKQQRYERLYNQIKTLVEKDKPNPVARMATIVAVLHHKMDYFFWTGFYLLVDGELIVGPYQGPLACIKLAKDKGVCWAGINRTAPVVVDNVEKFPGHIACDSRSKSEVVVPLRNKSGEIYGVLDVDSKELNSFDEVDAEMLGRILELVY